MLFLSLALESRGSAVLHSMLLLSGKGCVGKLEFKMSQLSKTGKKQRKKQHELQLHFFASLMHNGYQHRLKGLSLSLQHAKTKFSASRAWAVHTLMNTIVAGSNLNACLKIAVIA